MVIFYDKTSLEIMYTESSVSVPTLPEGTLEGKRRILAEGNINFAYIEKEMGLEIYNYKVAIENENVSIVLK